MKAEFLMLAQEYDSRRHSVYSWYMSQKLDGMRAFWDGGISRGLACPEVPYANVSKHDRYVIPPLATGLWSRYAQPIQAPNWWLDKLPKIPLDGELVCSDGFQDTVSIVKRISGSQNWEKIQYAVFDSPTLLIALEDRDVNNGNMKKKLRNCVSWAKSRSEGRVFHGEFPFYQTLNLLNREVKDNDTVYVLPQEQLPSNKVDLDARMTQVMEKALETGQEGVMLRSPISLWNPIRSWDLLKCKVVRDMEGTVVGYKWADKTDMERSISGEQTNKLLGLMGSVRLRLDSGLEFDLGCGFTNEERVMRATSGVIHDGNDKLVAKHTGQDNPGAIIGDCFENPLFPRGTKLTFKYRELTNDGLPKEARYWRKRVD
jgi:DNA ligase-1